MAKLETRKYHILLLFSLFGLVYLFRLFYIQVLTDQYFERAERVSVDKVIEYPVRGNIYDRNGALLVQNDVAYDILVTPRKVKVDTAKFCELLEITKEDFIERMAIAKNYSWRKASVFESMIKAEEFGRIREKLYQFQGFTVQNRTVRRYPSAIAAHVLGHLSKVSPRDLKRDEFYVKGDFIGESGLERSYEHVLRGSKGYRYYLKDINGNHISSYLSGQLDTMPKPGMNLVTSIDAELQAYGEELMQGKLGAIVAIEPKTGEVLSMISAPTYDPNVLVGRKYGKNYKILEADSRKILFQRALKSKQPPGSIVKTMQSLIALDMGIADENTRFPCIKSLVGCHNHPSPLNLPQAVQNSCNPYYYALVKRILFNGKNDGNIAQLRDGLDAWEKYARSFGLGNPLNIDLIGEKDGNVPDVREYDNIYGKNHWNYRTIYSIAIGQGEFSLTPLQMCNMACILANKGYYRRPHFVKEIGDSSVVFPDSTSFFRTLIDSVHFDLVHKGMQWVLEEPGGTARSSRLEGVTICGKTGTSQNPHGDDHSVFIAFAPKENPKIAIAVFVENAGGGGGTAAPIASLMIEKYLNREVKRLELETLMKEKKFY